jgi:hypothetical protein
MDEALTAARSIAVEVVSYRRATDAYTELACQEKPLRSETCLSTLASNTARI